MHSFPQEWRLLLKALNVNSIPSRSETATNRDLENIRVDGISVVDIQQLTGNTVYKSLISMKA